MSKANRAFIFGGYIRRHVAILHNLFLRRRTHFNYLPLNTGRNFIKFYFHWGESNGITLTNLFYHKALNLPAKFLRYKFRHAFISHINSGKHRFFIGKKN